MSGNKKSNKTGNVVALPTSIEIIKGTETELNAMPTNESIIVAQPNDEVKVITIDEPKKDNGFPFGQYFVDDNPEIPTGLPTQETSPVVDQTVEEKIPDGTTTEVVKIEVPKRVEASLLSAYDVALLNYVFSQKETVNLALAYANSLALKDKMVKESLEAYELLTLEYDELMSRGRIRPHTEEFKKLQDIMVALDDAEKKTEELKVLDHNTLAAKSLSEFITQYELGIQAVKLDVLGKETTNSGKPEGSKRSTNGHYSFEGTISFWRFESDLILVESANMPQNWLDTQEIKGNWYIAFNRSGKIEFKLSGDVITSANALFKACNVALGHDEGEQGNNGTSIGSRETDKKQIAKHPVLTLAELWQLVGASPDEVNGEDTGNNEVGIVNSPVVTIEVPNNGASVAIA